MANRTYRPRPYTEDDDIDFEEEYGASRFLRSDIRARPELRSGFDYSQLEEKYPVTSVSGRVQLEQKRKQDRPYLLEDLEYKKTLLEERAAELGIKKAARDLDLFEVNLNRENMILEQIPLARQKLGQLDPRDPDYLKKRMAVIEEHPLPFESKQFVDVIDEPLLNRHLRMRDVKIEMGGEIPKEDFQKSAMLLRDKETLRLAGNGDEEAQILLLEAQDIVDRYKAQIGYAPGQRTLSPKTQPAMGMEDEFYAPVPQGGGTMSPLDALDALTGGM